MEVDWLNVLVEKKSPTHPLRHPCLLQGTRYCQCLERTSRRLFLRREKLNSLKFDSLLWLSRLLEFP